MKNLLGGIADLVQKKVRNLPKGFVGRDEIGQGASGSATSRIDKLAEDTILEHLKKNGIWLNVLSEEAGFIDLKADSTLIVDPIDGTANFNEGIPFYAISLAVGSSRMSDVTHGLVRDLVSGDTFYGEKGKGAFLNDARISTRSFKRSEALLFAYVGMKVSQPTWKVVEVPRRVRSLGCASLEMCYVACGRADGFYFNCDDFSKRMRIVDIAASALILREAGGEVYDLRGRPLDVSFSLDDKVNFLALGDKSTKELIL